MGKRTGRPMGRPRHLTDEQVAELRRRYSIYRENKPAKLAQDFGISKSCLDNYIEGRHKEHRSAT